MNEFLIVFGFIGALWVPVIVMFVVLQDGAKRKIAGALVCLIFWLIFSIGFWGQETGNQERWNNGHCECGQHWELKAVDRSRGGSVTKYYSCPECYTEIELHY